MAGRSGKADDITQLKQAEAEAADIVRAVREERKAKLKQASREAQAEIEEYKREREAWLRAELPEVTSLEAEERARVAETDAEIEALKREYAANKDAVIDLALQIILNIDNPFVEAK